MVRVSICYNCFINNPWSGKDKFAKLFTMKQTAYVYSRDLNGKIIHSRDYEATLDGADSFWLDVIIH